jgi:hypothetical protein
VPAYSLGEAAHYLRMPEGTLRSWVVGKLYPVTGANRRSDEVFSSPDPPGRPQEAVSVFHQPRRGTRPGRALDYVSRQFRVEHPLINQAFQTDGLDLFVERYGELINASREGQHTMKEIIGVYLKRIEWDSNGIPVKLYPCRTRAWSS